jgi:hypothetical protein
MGGDSKEFKDDPTFVPWGPFVSPHFVNEPISRTDIITASVVWGLTLVAACSAIFLGYGQTRSSRSPLRSAYVWMIWIELAVCFAMGLECYLHMLKTIRPSKPARYHRAQDLADSAQALHYTSLLVMLIFHYTHCNRYLTAPKCFFGVYKLSCFCRSLSTAFASL